MGKPITALSRSEVKNIVGRFESLNPTIRIDSRSILKVHKLNWDRDKKRRQLFGYSIAAKRYALYTKTATTLKLSNQKRMASILLSAQRLTKGWDRDVPSGYSKPGLDHAWCSRPEATRLPWFDLPVMMKLALSTRIMP